MRCIFGFRGKYIYRIAAKESATINKKDKKQAKEKEVR
jgi:hypothetical protein